MMGVEGTWIFTSPKPILVKILDVSVKRGKQNVKDKGARKITHGLRIFKEFSTNLKYYAVFDHVI